MFCWFVEVRITLSRIVKIILEIVNCVGTKNSMYKPEAHQNGAFAAHTKTNYVLTTHNYYKHTYIHTYIHSITYVNRDTMHVYTYVNRCHV